MSDFVVSARKYRPSNFDEIVGQSVITSTLKNAINSNQLAQSFLFCGPRGVGKTSCARIFAKEINQFHNNNDVDDFSFNIFELDAASNNSVEDIRNLTDQVRVPPQIGKYKVYIIDEVHMLSTQAFNAFLKTLEEPPAHAKFILATTEKNKIIPTILSRCQIFDFKRIDIKNMTDYLIFVAKQEDIVFEEEALNLIAQKSDGSMRDALSLFDMLASYSEQNISYKAVISHLNILDYECYFDLINSILQKDVSKVLMIFNNVLENGFDAQYFIHGLSSHFRDLLVAKNTATLTLLEKGLDIKERFTQQSSNCSLAFIIKALEFCNECDLQYTNTYNKRILIEFCLLRILSMNNGDIITKENTDSLDINFHPLEDNKKKIIIEKNDDNRRNEDAANKKDVVVIEQSEVQDLDEGKNITSTNEESKTLSIAAQMEQLNNKKKEDKEEGEENIQNIKFGEDNLQKVWREIIDIFKVKRRDNLAIILSLNKPLLQNDFEIHILVDNLSQVELIEGDKYVILDLLQEKLDNQNISIKIEVVPKEEKDNVPYTNRDKFKKMMESNPNIESLRLKLGLDPDY